MKQNNNKTTTLFCFSPLVMLTTFVAEIVMMAYVLWRYGLDRVTRLVALILLNLGLFQLAEFMICEGAVGFDSLQWARLGFVAITVLPPLGLHLGMRLSGRLNRPLLITAYASAAFFAATFLFAAQGMRGEACLGNYVIFNIADWADIPYALYYYGWLLVGAWLSLKAAEKTKKPHLKRALNGLVLGYGCFVIPTTAVNLINPSTIAGIPSIMCGFAVIFAFILAFYVVPQYKKLSAKDRALLTGKKVRS